MSTNVHYRRVLSGLALGAGLFFSHSSAAQAPADDTRQEPAASADVQTQDLNRVLHLVGGGTVRGRTRQVDGHWEYRSGGDWTALPAGAVERVAEERDLFAQARELERGLGRDDTTRRVALGDWMLRAGLLEEGLQQLDRVLALDPDQPDAIKLLAAPPAVLKAPGESAEDLGAAVRAAATAPPALSEIAIARLGARAERAAVVEELAKSLVSYSPRIRALAARALRRLAPGEQVRGLIGRAVLDGSDSVRLEASLSLGAVKDAAVTVPVVKALASSSSAVRTNAIEALGNMGYADAVYPLISRLDALSAPAVAGGGGWSPPGGYIFVGRQFAYVQDFDVEVAQFASIAKPVVNTAVEGSVLDARVVGVWEVSFAVESRDIRTALHKLTGADPGNSNKAWLGWWQQNKSKFMPGNEPPATAPATKAG
jgi:hypothetical protein